MKFYNWSVLFGLEMEQSDEHDQMCNQTKASTLLDRLPLYSKERERLLRYLEDEIFRQRVDGLLHNRRGQLQISYRQHVNELFLFRNASWECFQSIYSVLRV